MKHLAFVVALLQEDARGTSSVVTMVSAFKHSSDVTDCGTAKMAVMSKIVLYLYQKKVTKVTFFKIK